MNSQEEGGLKLRDPRRDGLKPSVGRSLLFFLLFFFLFSPERSSQWRVRMVDLKKQASTTRWRNSFSDAKVKGI